MLEIEGSLDLALLWRETDQQARHAGLNGIGAPAASTCPRTGTSALGPWVQMAAAGGADDPDRLAGLVSHGASRRASERCRPPTGALMGPLAPSSYGSEPPHDPHPAPGD